MVARGVTTSLCWFVLIALLCPGPAIAQDAQGPIVAWGNPHHGQCNVPEPNREFVAIAAGCEYSLGLKADGSIVAWGLNDYGQCSVPAPNTGFVAVGAGKLHSLGLKADILGDLNCDGVLDFDDINPFVLAISSHTQYQEAFPDCYWRYADCNGDGYVDFDDINPFVAILSG
jgi:hypothetical protein